MHTFNSASPNMDKIYSGQLFTRYRSQNCVLCFFIITFLNYGMAGTKNNYSFSWFPVIFFSLGVFNEHTPPLLFPAKRNARSSTYVTQTVDLIPRRFFIPNDTRYRVDGLLSVRCGCEIFNRKYNTRKVAMHRASSRESFFARAAAAAGSDALVSRRINRGVQRQTRETEAKKEEERETKKWAHRARFLN